LTQRSLEEIPLSDGGELHLTVATPESAVRGGIVVVPDARGVTDTVWQLAEGLAREGWLAVIPHLYHRCGVDDAEDGDPEQVHRYVARLSAESVDTDIDASLRWLAKHGFAADRIGVVGFGLGGAVALIVAARRDVGAAVTVDGIGVVVPVAPMLPALVEAAPGLRCPWLGLYGDRSGVAEEEVHKLRDAAHSARVATDLVHYCLDTDQSTADETWARTLNWFDCHLR
jgi:carboxymethylenebutenolidase